MNYIYSLFPVMLSLSLNAGAVDTTSSAINLSITVVKDTCTISESDSEQTVNLGEWPTRYFRSAGDATQTVPFMISLTDCPTSGNLYTTFSGTASDADSELLAVSSASTATNVAIEILDSNGARLPLATQSAATVLDSSGDTLLSFGARYIAITADVEAGSAESVATFSVSYE